MADKTLGTRLNRLSLNAKTAIAEQGINVLYLAFGLLRWDESPTSVMPLLSPLLLVPVQLDLGRDRMPLGGLAFTKRRFLRTIASENSSSPIFVSDCKRSPKMGWKSPAIRAAFLRSVSAIVQVPTAHSRWEVMDRVILGTFNFQKLAMWQDLGDNRDQIPPCMTSAVHRIGDDTAPVSGDKCTDPLGGGSP